MTSEEKLLVEENVEYVLGMYDLYPNDHDIVIALKNKNLPAHLVPAILFRVKEPAYQKRIGQGKNMMMIGGGIFSLMVIVYIILVGLPGADTLMTGKQSGEVILRVQLRAYSKLFYITAFGALLQFFIGLYTFFKYKNLLRKLKDQSLVAAAPGHF